MHFKKTLNLLYLAVTGTILSCCCEKNIGTNILENNSKSVKHKILIQISLFRKYTLWTLS